MYFEISTQVSNTDKYASELLKEASDKKYSDINAAIELLKKAYIEIAKTNISFPVETFLRLPMYLQAANRPDEAWIEFNNLLKNGYPNQMKNKELIPMDESHIYDKMRLFLQREKQAEKAISYGIYSILLDCKGLYLQKRMKELNSNKDFQSIKIRITPLLKKASKLDTLDKIANIVINELNNFPQISTLKEIEVLIKRNFE